MKVEDGRRRASRARLLQLSAGTLHIPAVEAVFAEHIDSLLLNDDDPEAIHSLLLAIEA
jgi:hypothetical protein